MKLWSAINRFMMRGKAQANSRSEAEREFLALRRMYRSGLYGDSEYSPMARCIELVCSEAAKLISESVYAVDEERRPLRSTRAMRAVEVLRTSLDGGRTPSYYGLMDILYDIATDGNGLVLPVYGVAGRVTRLERIEASSASWIHEGSMAGHYRGTKVGTQISDVYAPGELIHARWGAVRNGTDRMGISPLRILSRSIGLGSGTEKAILRELGLGPESRAVLTAAPTTVALSQDEMPLDDDSDSERPGLFGDREPEKVEVVRRASVLNGLPETPVEKQQMKLLAHQVMAVANFYGCPPVFAGAGGSASGEDFKNLRRLGVLPLACKFLEAAQVRLLRPGARFRINSTVWEFEDANGRAALMDRLWPNTGRAPACGLDQFREVGGLGPASAEERAEIERLWQMAQMAQGSGVVSGSDGGDGSAAAGVDR